MQLDMDGRTLPGRGSGGVNGDRDSGSGTTTSLRSRSSGGTYSQQNISMNSLNEGMVQVYDYTTKKYKQFIRNMKCEEICTAMCRELNIRPVVQLIFGICEHRDPPAKSKSKSKSNNSNSVSMGFWVLPGECLSNELRYCFRIRFRMTDMEKQLRFIDPQSFNYLYYQMRHDMVHEQISEIRYPDHKNKVLGLAVIDMRIDLESQSSGAEAIQRAYKTYLPHSLWNNHGLFTRPHIHNVFQELITSSLDFADFKFHYISSICSLAPTYMMEQYRAIVDELPNENFNNMMEYHGITISTSASTTTSHGSGSTSILSNGTNSTTTLSTLAPATSCNGLASDLASGTSNASSTATSNSYSLTNSSSRKFKGRSQKKTNDVRPKGIDVLVRLWSHESTDPGLKIARVSAVPKWSLVAITEDIIMISPDEKEKKVLLEISGMQSGFDMYFETVQEMKSFVSYLGIYMRLTGIWLRDLCLLYKTPSLVELRELSCHGPIGGAYSLMKLHEKSDKCGSYIIRQCDREYSTYYIDINVKCLSGVHKNHRFQTETWKILRAEKQERQWILVQSNGVQTAFATLHDVALSIVTDSLERRCVPPSFHDKYPLLLLCLPKNLKNKKTDIQLSDFDLRRRNPQLLNPSKDLQCYPVTCDKSNDNIMFTMRGDWLQKGSFKDVPVTLKILRNDGDYAEFMMMTGKWGLIESPQFLKLYGLTLANPLTMVMEYASYGPFDRFLKKQPNVALSNLIQVCLGLARGIHYLSEYRIIHNYIRCSNLFITEYKPPHTLVKIGDPGYPRPYQESDFAWIPTKFYNNPEAAKVDPSTQIWAFATTIYEIFSRCREDLRLMTQATLIQNKTQYANILPELDPQLCPPEISETIMDGWSDDVESQFHLQVIVTRLHEIKCPHTEMSENDLAFRPEYNGYNDYYDESFMDNGAESNVTTDDAKPFDYMHFPIVIEVNGGRVRFNKHYKNDKIGEGHFGVVYKGRLVRYDGYDEPVAIKRLHTRNITPDFQREMDIMQDLSHQNVVEFKFWAPQFNAIIMEFLDCSFDVYLRSSPDLPRRQLESYALDIAKGMEYLAGRHIIHRDLAARNVLVDINRSIVKISDFGLSQRVNEAGYYFGKTERHLPIKWYSPEAINDQKHSMYSDIWSYGVTLYETFTRGSLPELDPIAKTETEFLTRLQRGARLPRPQPLEACADFVYNDIMLKCWNEDPKNRPTFTMIIEIFRRNNIIGVPVSESSQHQHQQQHHHHHHHQQQQLQNGNNIENDHSFRTNFERN
ncbi:tyrosine-protein kinase hopscotch [Drosophila tropicalis]|uniref:tyrosine-protein kinase hopscotch n=1 Tax=Drosophila tropicalis TaxID=46794 RepID=UPI0035ABCFB0